MIQLFLCNITRLKCKVICKSNGGSLHEVISISDLVISFSDLVISFCQKIAISSNPFPTLEACL